MRRHSQNRLLGDSALKLASCKDQVSRAPRTTRLPHLVDRQVRRTELWLKALIAFIRSKNRAFRQGHFPIESKQMTTTVTPSHMPPVLAIGGRSAYSQGGTRFIAAVCALASLALLSLPAAAVNKCTGPGGQITFQDAPCVGKGEALTVRPASGRGPAPLVQHASPVAERAPPNPPAAPAPVSAPAVASQTPLEREADMCLDWYKPLLRDPNGAYVKQVMKDKRVLSMDVHATNGYGGYVIKRASCEIHNGQLNESWTKNHARRGGWGVE